ncbi:MAG: MopE-related protein [Polyangiales bacterium]
MAVATFEGIDAGTYELEVQLLDAAGELVVKTRSKFELRTSFSTTVFLGRECVGVMCPDGQTCAEGKCKNYEVVVTDPDGGIDPNCVAGGETCDNTDEDCDGRVDEGVTKTCTNACDAAGTQTCSAGTFGACSAPASPQEVCDKQDNDCDGMTDESLSCGHTVVCSLLNADGSAVASGTTGLVYGLDAGGFGNVLCMPDGTATGRCGAWWGNCKAQAGSAGHTHDVRFEVFDDGYANSVEVTQIRLNGAGSICGKTAAGAEACRKWFGRATALEAVGHTHEVRCSVFSDGGASKTARADAVFWNGSQMVIPGGASGVARRWVGDCASMD